MTFSITYSMYINWLLQAYKYYFLDDADITDSEWDFWSGELYKAKDGLPQNIFPVVHREEFVGRGLFWLKKSEYPSEVLARVVN